MWDTADAEDSVKVWFLVKYKFNKEETFFV